MKKYLKAKEINRLVALENNELSVKIPGDDPMNISSINSALSVQLPTKWSKLNAENWKILKDALLKVKFCLSCRDYVEFGHTQNSTCKFKSKEFEEIFQILNRLVLCTL